MGIRKTRKEEPTVENTLEVDKVASVTTAGGSDELQKLFSELDPPEEKKEVVPPLSVRGTILAPGYWQAFEGKSGQTNVFSWLGLLLAIPFFPLGIIFSSIGLENAKAVPNDTIGRIVGWVGLVVSSAILVFFILWLLLLPFAIMNGHGQDYIATYPQDEPYPIPLPHPYGR